MVALILLQIEDYSSNKNGQLRMYSDRLRRGDRARYRAKAAQTMNHQKTFKPVVQNV